MDSGHLAAARGRVHTAQMLSRHAADAHPSDRAGTAGFLLLRALCGGTAYLLAGQLGLLTTVHDAPLMLAAPPAGIAVIWFSSTTRRSLPYDAAALSLAGGALSAQLGLPAWLVAFGAVVNVGLVAAFVLPMRRYCPDLVPFGEDRMTWRIADLGVFWAAAAFSAGVVAVLGTGSQAAAGLPNADLGAFLVRWGRTAATVVAVAPLGLLLIPFVRRAAALRGRRRWLVATVRAGSPRVVEATLLMATTAFLYAVVFIWLADVAPLSFLLLPTTAWAGIRFSPAFVAAHGLLGGATAVAFTLSGHGVFAASIADPTQRAVVAQLFVLSTCAPDWP